MTLRELLELYDNLNGKLRINDENCDEIIEYENAYKLSMDSERESEEYEYLLDCHIMAFGFYDETLCVRVFKTENLKRKFTCADCSYYYKDNDDDDWSYCHYGDDDGYAPCTYEEPEEINYEEYI